MKTVLLIDTLGNHYFEKITTEWKPTTTPSNKGTLWVIVNLPEESLEAIDLPRLSGNDKNLYIERRLASIYTESTYRAAYPIQSVRKAGANKTNKLVLTGLTTSKEIAPLLESIPTPIAGVWGITSLLVMLSKSLKAPDVLIALPNKHELRILVIKDKVPILTRCVNTEESGPASEILITRLYTENQHIFERGHALPVLFLGDQTLVETPLNNAGLTLLPVPKVFLRKNKTDGLYPLFDRLITSPIAQLAPITVRTPYLVRNIKRAAYAGALVSLLAACIYGQDGIQTLLDQQGQEQNLQTKLQKASHENQQLAARLTQSKTDPELMRRAIQFKAQEIDAAPSPEDFLRLAASAIADFPDARIKALSFYVAPGKDSLCKENTQSIQSNVAQAALNTTKRVALLQFTILLPNTFSSQARTDARQRISTALTRNPGIKLLQDPEASARNAAIKGGAINDNPQIEDRWCVNVPWKTVPKING